MNTNIIPKIWAVMKKNVLRLLDSKISAIAILFGPLILISVMGLAFQSNGFFGIKLGVYSQNYTTTSDSMIDVLKTSNFSVEKMQSNNSCIVAVKNGEKQLCMIFPKDFKTGRMEFYADYSRTRLAELIMNKISSQVSTLSSQIGVNSAQSLLDTLNSTATSLSARSADIKNMQKGFVNVKTSLTNIKHNLDNVTVDNDTETLLNDITNDSSRFNSNLKEAKRNLVETKSQLVLSRDRLNTAYSSIPSKNNNLDDAIASFNCTSFNSNDLSSYLDSSQFADVLQQQANPICSLLWTVQAIINDNINEMKQTVADVDTTISYIDSINENMDFVETDIKTRAAKAKQNMDDAKTMRASALVQINNMSDAADSGIITLDSMNVGLNKVSNNLGQLANTNPQDIINPIKTSFRSIESRTIQILDILFPMMILLIILFVGILLGNILIMREKTSKAYFRNLILPSKGYIFVIGTYLTILTIILFQLLIIFAIGLGVFHINVFTPILTLIAALVGVTMIFSSIGMLIGYTSKSEETSVLISIIVSLILFIFSNIVNPLETMTPIIHAVAQFSPFNIIELVLRKAMIYGSSINTVSVILLSVFILEMSVGIILTLYLHNKTFNGKN